MPRFKDLTGFKFNRLTVLKLSRDVMSGKRYRKYWLCKCECGNLKEVRTDCLTQGMVKSCGCLAKEKAPLNAPHRCKYEVQDRRLYGIWRGMNSRCFNDKDQAYSRYGFRGISVCEEWNKSFDVFAKWSLSNGYSDKLTIDRIDNNGNYEPFNCRWISMKEQSRNRRSNVIIKYDGNEFAISEFCEFYKLDYSMTINRIKRGWNISDLFIERKDNQEARSKLTKEDVICIRKLYSNNVSLNELCEKYPIVSKESIKNIINRKTWKNL